MDAKKTAQQVLEQVGGAENVTFLTHCVTRLRFNLKSMDGVDEAKVKAVPGVVGVVNKGGQYQVIIGNEVAAVYDELMKLGDFGGKEVKQLAAPAEEKKSRVSIILDTLAGVFTPLMPLIAGAGMIKGLMGGLVALGVVSNATDTYKIIDMLASGVFTFLPFFIAASAAKKFKTNHVSGHCHCRHSDVPHHGGCCQGRRDQQLYVCRHPAHSGIQLFWFGHSHHLRRICLSYIYKWVDNIVPEAARTVITPTITLFISGFFALTVIGPVGIYIGKGLAWMLDVLFGISPIFAGVVMGLIRPASILVGMHHAMTPIALENFATKGYDMLMPMMFIANLSIVGAAAGCYFKEKTQKERSIVLSSVLSGILGITEPALFGV